MKLTREQILSANDLPTKVIPVPEWNGSVEIRQLSIDASNEWNRGIKAASEDERADATIFGLVVLSVVDESGALLFTAADVAELRKKNPNVVRRIFDACLELNKATAPEVEKLEKN